MADQETTAGGTETEGLDDASKKASIPTAQPQNIALQAGLPTRPLEEESPTPPVGIFGNDVARILQEVKLPERKEFRANADTAPQQPEPINVSEEVLPEAPAPKSRETVSAIHTLKDDFQTAVQDQKLSRVQAAALEQEKRSRQSSMIPTAARVAQRANTVKTILIVLAFFSLGAVALGASVLIMRDRANVAPATFLVEGLLFSEQTVPFPIQNMSATDIKLQLAAARSSSGLTLGAITRIAPIFEEVTQEGAKIPREAKTGEFLKALNAQIPDELLRALGQEYFFGFHTVDENAPVFIVPVTSYERAFAGMLVWEKTINADFAPIFTSVPSLTRQSDGLLVERPFTDMVMRNFDVRTLKDDSGVIQLYYSFPTRTILIIAESQYSFTEILARLRADRRI